MVLVQRHNLIWIEVGAWTEQQLYSEALGAFYWNPANRVKLLSMLCRVGNDLAHPHGVGSDEVHHARKSNDTDCRRKIGISVFFCTAFLFAQWTMNKGLDYEQAQHKGTVELWSSLHLAKFVGCTRTVMLLKEELKAS